jgi:hypothetical protein
MLNLRVIFFFALFIIVSANLNLFSQQVNKNEVNIKNRDKYKQLKVKCITEYWDNKKEESYYYDTSGNLTANYIYGSEEYGRTPNENLIDDDLNNGKPYNFYYKYLYNEKGDLTEKRLYNFYSALPYYFDKYVYNESGILQKLIHLDSNMQIFSCDSFAYNKNEFTYYEYHNCKNNGKDVSFLELYIKYDDLGRIIEEQSSDRLYCYIYSKNDDFKTYKEYKQAVLDTSKMKNFIETYLYVYNNNGRLIVTYKDRKRKWNEHINKDTLNGEQKYFSGFPYFRYDSREIYKYDENGNLNESKLFFNGDEMYERTIYSYDEFGRNISEKTISATGNITKDIVRKYDYKGNMTEESDALRYFNPKKKNFIFKYYD